MATLSIHAYMLSCEKRAQIREQTLANLAATDWGDRVSIELDHSLDPRPQGRIEETAKTILCRAYDEGADFLLFLEDDLDFNRHLRHNLQHWRPVVDAGPEGHFFASLYNPNVCALQRDPGNAVLVADPNTTYGSQALLIARATVLEIIRRWDEVVGMPDIKMPRLAAAVCPVLYHLPSLVQHMPVPSVWGGSSHRALDFDATWRAGDSTCRARPPSGSAMSVLAYRPLRWPDSGECDDDGSASRLSIGFRPLVSGRSREEV